MSWCSVTITTEEKCIQIIEISGKKSDWDGWSEIVRAGKHNGFKKLLTGKGDLVGFNKIQTQDKFDLAVPGNSEHHKTIMIVGQMNELAYEDIILSINHRTKEGNVAFKLVKNCKREPDFPEGNCHLACGRLVVKYEPHTTPSYFDLKNRFENSTLVSIDDDPDEWITELEILGAKTDHTKFSSPMTDGDFLVHVLNNLSEEYDTFLDGLQSQL